MPPRSAYAKAACGAALAGALIGGCGSTQATPVLPAAAAARMRADLARLHASASVGNPAGARADLDAFAGEVAGQSSAGHLTPATHAALETAIARTRARIDAEVTAPAATAPAVATTAPAVATTPQVAAPTPPPSAGGKGKDKPAKGGDKGKGHGKH